MYLKEAFGTIALKQASKVGKAQKEYSDNILLEKLYFLELGNFSFLTGNDVMHLKNFSMLHSIETWTLVAVLALSYLPFVNPDDTEE